MGDHITGVNAKVYAGSTGAVLISGAHNWSMEKGAKLDDATNYASAGWEEDVVGNKNATVSIDLLYDTAQNICDTTPVTGANLVEGATVILKLYIDLTKYYTGTFHITGAGIAVPQGAKISQNIKAKLHGALDESHL
jgi:hypothetical protein